MNRQKVIDFLRSRVWLLLPILLMVLGYYSKWLLGEFLCTFAMCISSAVVVAMTNGSWPVSEKQRQWPKVCLTAIVTFLVVHLICSAMLISLWSINYQLPAVNFFTGEPWMELVFTPAWMSMLAILLNLWLSPLLKKYKFWSWLVWAVILVAVYLCMDIMNEVGLRDGSIVFTWSDYVEITLVGIMAIGILVSCLTNKRLNMLRPCPQST